jgi:hypothetical protein
MAWRPAGTRGEPVRESAIRIRLISFEKKQGAAGITTAAPYIAGQWGRGDNRLPG